MNSINYLSAAIIPGFILLIMLIAVIEKRQSFDIFLEGAKEGIEIVFKIFPTLIGIFLAIGALRSSGVLDFFIDIILPITTIFNVPSEILPIALLRPISGSASIGVATDIMSKYGVDSLIGLMTATIMGSTETTFYTIAIYTSTINVKNTRRILLPALLADIAGIATSVVIWRFLS